MEKKNNKPGSSIGAIYAVYDSLATWPKTTVLQRWYAASGEQHLFDVVFDVPLHFRNTTYSGIGQLCHLFQNSFVHRKARCTFLPNDQDR